MYSRKPAATVIRQPLILTKEHAAAFILITAVFFNAALAIENGHLHQLSQIYVSLAEAVITGLAVLLVAVNFRTDMLPWAVLLVFILLLHLVLSFVNQAVNPKIIRDVIDIPVFIALGMVYARGNIVKLFFYIQTIVLAVLLMELIDVDTYSQIFKIQDYYMNTREITQHAFWNTDSTLFVSATRPGERFLLDFLGIHRLSSVFLEPVSLGNYGIVATIFTLAFWREMSRWMKFFFVISTVCIVIGCDGRLAAVSCAILVICAPIFPLLPRYSNLTFLPGVFFFSALAVGLLALRHSTDDFVGRLSGSIDLLGGLDLGAIFGLDPLLAAKASDSGISYFVLTQSVIGVAVMWIFICLVPRYRTRISVILIYSICTYVPLNLLVSYSLFSIKTAAPMWFMYGYLTAETTLRRTAPRQNRRLPIGMMPVTYGAVEGRR